MPFRGDKQLRAASWWMMLVWLLFYGAVDHTDCRDAPISSLFLRAAKECHIERQKMLLRHGANINERHRDDNGNTALLWVVWYGLRTDVKRNSNNTEAEALSELRFLLEHGADPNIRGRDGQTALTVAAVYNEWHAIKLLKEYGAVR